MHPKRIYKFWSYLKKRHSFFDTKTKLFLPFFPPCRKITGFVLRSKAHKAASNVRPFCLSSGASDLISGIRNKRAQNLTNGCFIRITTKPKNKFPYTAIFDLHALSRDTIPAFSNCARPMISLFGSACVCGQLFLRANIVKNHTETNRTIKDYRAVFTLQLLKYLQILTF